MDKSEYFRRIISVLSREEVPLANARRFVLETQDHFEEIVSQRTSSPGCPRSREEEAIMRIGNPERLAEKLAQEVPRKRSLWRVLIAGLGTILLIPVLTCASLLFLMVVLFIRFGTAWTLDPTIPWRSDLTTIYLIVCASSLTYLVGPLLIVWLCDRWKLRQGAIMGLLILFCITASFVSPHLNHTENDLLLGLRFNVLPTNQLATLPVLVLLLFFIRSTARYRGHILNKALQ